MELKVGQKLRVKEFDEIPNHWREEMKKWIGKIVSFKEYSCSINIKIYQDSNEFEGHGWYWHKSDFQIVFNTWEDVRNAMEEECNKNKCCDGCRLDNKEGLCYSYYFRNKDYKKLAENFEKMFGMECYVLEEEKMNFTLENIKDEMIVKLRNGIIYMSLGKNFIGENGYMPKKKYSDNFKCLNNHDFDIVAVYPPTTYYTNGFKKAIINVIENSSPTWKEAEEPITKDVSLEEINALLKEKYPDVEKFNLPIDK